MEQSNNSSVNYWNLKEYILSEINKKGGWVNCHAHIDRAYTITKENFAISNSQRPEKWYLNRDLRINSNVTQIYDRMAAAIEKMIEQNVTALATYIDVDCHVKDKSIKAAQKIREKYKKDIVIKFMNQSSYGLFDKKLETKKWFDYGAEFVDIIGGLLKVDIKQKEEHMDILLSTAKKMNKKLFIHLDEQSLLEEKETEFVAKKTIEYKMKGQVVGIHGLSINMHPKTYREKVYKLIKKAEMMFVSCPIAWSNSRRSEQMSPTHNPVTPIDEMLYHDITVGIGTDNIADIWMPFIDGDMWFELRTLAELTRIHDLDILIKIATTNGRKILGI